MNSQGFTPKEVEQGLHLELLNTLLNYNKISEDYYNDIHITTDGYCLIIEWVSLPNDNSYGGQFKYVEEDQVVMLEKIFPDNHTEFCLDEEDYEERLAEWLEENPDYEKNEFGRWYLKTDAIKFMKDLNKKD